MLELMDIHGKDHIKIANEMGDIDPEAVAKKMAYLKAKFKDRKLATCVKHGWDIEEENQLFELLLVHGKNPATIS